MAPDDSTSLQNISEDPNNNVSTDYLPPAPQIPLAFLGLAAMFFGLLLGALFGGGMFHQEGYLSEAFSNTLLLITIPLGYGVFKFSGLFRYSLVYPIVLAIVGDSLKHSAAFMWLRDVLSHSSLEQDAGSRLAIGLMVAAVWVVLALLIEGIAAALNATSNLRMASYTVTAILPLIVLAAFLGSGSKLTTARAQSVISFSQPELPGVSVAHVDGDQYAVNYVGTGKADSLFVDTHHSYTFGKNACLSVQDDLGAADYQTKTVGPKHFPYGYAAFARNASNPPRPEYAYTNWYYCFVINGDRYVLKRDDLMTNAQIKSYPAEAIIQSALASKQVPGY